MSKQPKAIIALAALLSLTISWWPAPAHGLTLPIRWGDIGEELVRTGTLNQARVETPTVMTSANAHELLNLLWAVGLGQKSEILEHGPMMDPRYGGAENFASTGGWTLARGPAMAHYSQHHFVTLTAAQEELVAKTAKQIFRPCCPNSTYFPDCNHGMAMLGLLELMAANGKGEAEMLRVAHQVNALWFPQLALASPPGCAV